MWYMSHNHIQLYCFFFNIKIKKLISPKFNLTKTTLFMSISVYYFHFLSSLTSPFLQQLLLWYSRALVVIWLSHSIFRFHRIQLFSLLFGFPIYIDGLLSTFSLHFTPWTKATESYKEYKIMGLFKLGSRQIYSRNKTVEHVTETKLSLMRFTMSLFKFSCQSWSPNWVVSPQQNMPTGICFE